MRELQPGDRYNTRTSLNGEFHREGRLSPGEYEIQVTYYARALRFTGQEPSRGLESNVVRIRVAP